MISLAAAQQRLSRHPHHRGLNLDQMSPRSFAQLFTGVAAGTTSAGSAFPFPTNTVILGITASAHVAALALNAAQQSNNRQAFGLNFTFANEALTPGGPVSAEALLGTGEDTIFPLRELVVPVGQSITCSVANYSGSTLSIHVVYHCLAVRSS